jgi:hypothetical protein
MVSLSNHGELVGVVSLSNHTVRISHSPFALRQAQGFRAAGRFAMVSLSNHRELVGVVSLSNHTVRISLRPSPFDKLRASGLQGFLPW